MFTEGEQPFDVMDDSSQVSGSATNSHEVNKKGGIKKQTPNVQPEELKVNNKESRASEALKVKDDQIKLLTEQNNTLYKQLDKVRILKYN